MRRSFGRDGAARPAGTPRSFDPEPGGSRRRSARPEGTAEFPAPGVGAGPPPGFRGTRGQQRRVLDRLAARAAAEAAPGPDPVHLARRFRDPADREIAGLLAALLAYGQVEVFCRRLEAVLDALGPSPSRALLAGRHRDPDFARNFAYRFQTGADLRSLLEACASLLAEEGGLGVALARRRRGTEDFDAAFAGWVADLRRRAGAAGGRSRGLDHLLPDPGKGSACKRWRLYLRWMIRPAGPTDLGTWHGLLAPADLVLPLDTHWVRIGRRLGLTARRSPGDAMAREITSRLRAVDPDDPLRYDYAVCHLGIRGGCPPRLTAADCRGCELRSICPTGAAMGRAPR